MTRLILVILLVLLLTVFGMTNNVETVTLHYVFGWSSPPIPVYQLVLGTAFGTGAFVILLLVPEWFRLRMTLRRQRKALKQTEIAVGRLNRFEERDKSPDDTPVNREEIT